MQVTKSYRLSLLHSIPVDFVGEGCEKLHGHDLQVEVSLAGEPDKTSGLLVDRNELDRIVHREIIKPFHGQNANKLLPTPTGEVFAQNFLQRLKRTDLKEKIVAVEVRETRKNSYQVALKNS